MKLQIASSLSLCWPLPLLLLDRLLAVAATSPESAEPGRPGDAAATAGQYHDELLTYAIDNLNRLEEFDSADALQQVVQRLDPNNAEPGQPDRASIPCWRPGPSRRCSGRSSTG